MTNEIVLTVALPHGASRRALGGSASTSPLGPVTARLGDTDWRDWPATAGSLDFTVSIDGISLAPDQVNASPQPDSAIGGRLRRQHALARLAVHRPPGLARSEPGRG